MKKSVPFIHQVSAAKDAVEEVFCNTNVLRSATRRALSEIKEQVDGYILALDEDEADGVHDESLSP